MKDDNLKENEELLVDSWEEEALEIEEEFEEDNYKQEFERKKKVRKNSRYAK